MTIFVGVGGVNKVVSRLLVGVNGAWKQVNAVYVGVNGVWKLAHSLGNFIVTGGNYSVLMEPGAAAVTFQSDGTVAGSDGSVFSWGNPATPGIGVNYWIKVEQGTGNGTLITGNYGIWFQMGTSLTWQIQGAPNPQTRNRNMSFQIATDGVGANIVASGSISLVSTWTF